MAYLVSIVLTLTQRLQCAGIIRGPKGPSDPQARDEKQSQAPRHVFLMLQEYQKAAWRGRPTTTTLYTSP